MSHDITQNPFKSVPGQKAQRLFELVQSGKAVKKAEEEAGITIDRVSRMEDLNEYAQGLIARWNLKDDLGRALVVSRLYEVLMGEDDKNSIAAAGTLSKILNPTEKGQTIGVQVVINETPETVRLMERTLEFDDYQEVEDD